MTAAPGSISIGRSKIGPAWTREQRPPFGAREHIPYPLLNDSELVLASKLGLPTFQLGGARYYRRLTFVARAGRIAKVFYPVFPPQNNAAEVVDWLRGRG